MALHRPITEEPAPPAWSRRPANLAKAVTEELIGHAEQARQFLVGDREFAPAVHHQNDLCGLLDGDTCLLNDFGGDLCGFADQHPARIHQIELLSQPLRRAVDAVAGDARLIAHNCPAAAGDAIE